MNWTWLEWLAVAALGGIVGASELVSRYKDDPGAAVRTWAGVFYIVVNTCASIGAFALIRTNHWFAPNDSTQLLVAGVSAMAFFRTSLFVVRVGDRDVAVGPSGFLQIFLTAADRDVDRGRAAARSQAVATVMKGVDFEKAKKSLPPYCLGLMQNVSPDDQQTLKQAIDTLDASDADSAVKSLLLGLELMNDVGLDVLTTAVNSLGDEIRSTPSLAKQASAAG